MATIKPEQLLAEIEDVIRTMPRPEFCTAYDAARVAWIGRAAAVLHMWDPIKAIAGGMDITMMNSRFAASVGEGERGFLTLLHQARHDLRMRTIGPLTVAVGHGAVFDYFDEVRKIVEGAKIEVFFVDPYMDAEFASRYLPHVSVGVAVRLLGRESLKALTSAVVLFRQQNGISIEVRSAAGFHDRYVFIDKRSGYHSGASFKDGAKKAPTTLTQVVDTFPVVLETYEKIWTGATVQP